MILKLQNTLKLLKDQHFKLRRIKFGESSVIYQIRQSFPLPNIHTIQYILCFLVINNVMGIWPPFNFFVHCLILSKITCT